MKLVDGFLKLVNGFSWLTVLVWLIILRPFTMPFPTQERETPKQNPKQNPKRENPNWSAEARRLIRPHVAFSTTPILSAVRSMQLAARVQGLVK